MTKKLSVLFTDWDYCACELSETPLREIDFMVAIAMKEKCSNEVCLWINSTSWDLLPQSYL